MWHGLPDFERIIDMNWALNIGKQMVYVLDQPIYLAQHTRNSASDSYVIVLYRSQLESFTFYDIAAEPTDLFR